MPPAGERPRRRTVVLAGALLGLGAGAAMEGGALAPGVAHADSGRLSLQLGLGQRDDEIRAGRSQVLAEGTAVSGLSVAGAWFGGRPDGPLGVSVRLGVERFELVGMDGTAAAGQRVVANGLDVRAGAALRTGRLGPLRLEGEVGYGFLRLPLAALGEGTVIVPRLTATALDVHGPVARAAVWVELGRRLGIELAADAMPLSFGGRHQGASLEPRRFGGGAAISVGDLRLGATRLVAVLAADLSRTSASDGDASLTQLRRQVGIGVRGSWPAPPSGTPPAPVVAPPPPPPPAPVEPEPPPAPEPPTVITGLVRAEGGDLLDARVQLVELGIDVPVDERGTFRLEVPPGDYTLVITAPGFVEQRKQVSGASGEQRIYNVDLQMEAR